MSEATIQIPAIAGESKKPKSKTGVCLECKAVGPIHDHHIVPRVHGGTHTVPLCLKCHGIVHDKDLLTMQALSREGIKRNAGKRARPIKIKGPAPQPPIPIVTFEGGTPKRKDAIGMARLRALDVCELYAWWHDRPYMKVSDIAKDYGVPLIPLRRILHAYHIAHSIEFPWDNLRRHFDGVPQAELARLQECVLRYYSGRHSSQQTLAQRKRAIANPANP